MGASLKFRLRRARLADLSRVGQLEKRVWGPMAASPSVIRRRFFLFPQGFQVALAGLDLAGFCSAALFDVDALEVEVDEFFPPTHVPGGSHFFLFGLTVNPIYRRSGVATALIKKEIAVATRLGCRKIQLVANAFSRRVFRRLGFRAVATLSHLFRDYPELMPRPVLMEMDLVS